MKNLKLWSRLDAIDSRGKNCGKAGSMAELHAHRKLTLSQFFTPSWVVDFAWQCISKAFKPDEKYSLLDNSMGSASMFRHADPRQFELYGFDIDRELVAKVVNIFQSESYKFKFINASLSDVILGRYSAALINPPFSIQLDSQFLTPFAGITHFGKLGANSSALSHEYALAQALHHCDIVAAVLPSSTTAKLLNGDFPCINSQRLRAVLHLPDYTFVSETVNKVKVDLLIFSLDESRHSLKLPEKFYENIRVEASIEQQDPVINIPRLRCRPYTNQLLDIVHLTNTEPVIFTPKSDDKRVILRKAGRWIKLKFFDGATEVKVLNRLFGKKLVSNNLHRYPQITKFEGTYKLSLDVIVMQDDPKAALNSLCDCIAEFGGIPIIDHQLTVGLERLMYEHYKKSTKFSRTAYRKGVPSFAVTSSKTQLLNRSMSNSWIKKDEVVNAERTVDGYKVTTDRGQFECSAEAFFKVFSISEEMETLGYWEEVHPPIKNTFPKEIEQIEARAKTLGLDRILTMEFQFTDLCELAFMGSAICGWEMALGKTRLELSLALLMKGTSLIVLKSRLIDEMMKELESLDIPKSSINFVDSVEKARNLSKINIVSYETLRRPIVSRLPKFTFAHLLKNKINNIFIDEGGCLANSQTLQSIAINRVNAKNRFILDGTPCPNYPREMLALLHFISNGPKSYMPYSNDANGIFYAKWLIDSAKHQLTGRKAFLDNFSCFEWVTNEFFDIGIGAKREVPKVKNLPDFRELIGPFVKRRTQQEPAVTKHIRFPVPVLHEPITIEWDLNHLVQYVAVIEDFANWYRDHVAQVEDTKKCNLVAVLARLEECFKACNVPSTISSPVAKPFFELHSKERACIELIEQEIKKGRRPIVFAKNPRVLHRLSSALDALGITNLVFTGEESIKSRISRLNSQIREGDTAVMLASSQVTQDGLNLHQLNTFIFYNRSYMSRLEYQAIYRLVRPKQMSDVYGYFLHLEGSIDEYMGQMVTWKKIASEAGLDFGEQPNVEFFHFDYFINRYLESIPSLKNAIKLMKNRNKVA